MPRAGLTPQRVVEEAEALVDQSGLEALSLAALASRVGVRQPSLYNHVASLEALQRQLALRAKVDLAAVVREADSGGDGEGGSKAEPPADAPARLLRIGRALRAWAREHPGRYLLSVSAPRVDDPEDVAASQELVVLIDRVLAPELEGADRIHAIRAFRSLTHGAIDLERRGGFGLPVDVEASAERALEALAHALLGDALRP